LQTEASVATRNRKEDFKGYIAEVTKSCQNDQARIMDLASGPCRDIRELLSEPDALFSNLSIDCIDHDPHAIDYGKKMVEPFITTSNINFLQKNAARLALTKNIEGMIPWKYDLIFSTGLFDYVDERVAAPLVSNLRKLLKKSGLMIISNYRDKWSNPSRHYMEWGGDWELLYRTEEEFLEIFKKAGFSPEDLSLKFEPQKIMQYCFARN
jgi:2-polyprenyl-3-methyl-5-hydroxy-6-metoxy-1,4-benzoquinol methylase